MEKQIEDINTLGYIFFKKYIRTVSNINKPLLSILLNSEFIPNNKLLRRQNASKFKSFIFYTQSPYYVPGTVLNIKRAMSCKNIFFKPCCNILYYLLNIKTKLNSKAYSVNSLMSKNDILIYYTPLCCTFVLVLLLFFLELFYNGSLRYLSFSTYFSVTCNTTRFM